MRNLQIDVGQVWERRQPFIKDAVINDPASDIHTETVTWHPGIYETDYGESHDGFGIEIREIVAIVELPRPYHARVFYKRSWRAPDGYEFGKAGVRCTAVSAFTGWRYGSIPKRSYPATLTGGDNA